MVVSQNPLLEQIRLRIDKIWTDAQHHEPPSPNYSSGALAKFASLVGSAANGAVTNPIL